MAEEKEPAPPIESPLFDKMDALLARHRRPGGIKVDIPVLTEEAPVDAPPEIPVLTEVVAEPEPAFDSHDFFTAPFPTPQPDPDAPILNEEIFLDLPLLDLAGLADNPGGLPETAPQELPEPEAAQEPAERESSQPMPVADDAVNDIDEADTIEIAEVAEEPAALDEEVEALTLIEADHSWDDPQPELEAMAPPAPKLTEAALAEITASVAAHIAVDISTEVAQLTRQHFAGMMSAFYADSLHKLTEEISRDMEMCLAPRIAELVKDELRRQGLLE